MLYCILIQLVRWSNHLSNLSESSSISVFIPYFGSLDVPAFLPLAPFYVVVRAGLSDLLYFNTECRTLTEPDDLYNDVRRKWLQDAKIDIDMIKPQLGWGLISIKPLESSLDPPGNVSQVKTEEESGTAGTK